MLSSITATCETNQPVDVFERGESMTTTDAVFQRALSNMLTEIFDGPPGQEAYLLNPGGASAERSGVTRQGG